VKWRIQFERNQINRARERGKHILAVGIEGNGRCERFMLLSPEHATLVWLLSHGLARGEEPEMALRESLARIAAQKAEAEARFIALAKRASDQLSGESEVAS
jgi:hypothetical protein